MTIPNVSIGVGKDFFKRMKKAQTLVYKKKYGELDFAKITNFTSFEYTGKKINRHAWENFCR